MSEEQNHLELFVKGSVVGHLVGDTLGYAWSKQKIIPPEIDMISVDDSNTIGEYTSLGTFTLGTIASLNDCHTLDTEDLINKFYESYIGNYLVPAENCYDVGETTVQSINNFSNGMPADQCGILTEVDDADALSRILPVVLFYINDPLDTLISQVHKACAVTHTGLQSQVTCAVYSLLIRNLLLQKTDKAFHTLTEFYHQNNMINYVQYLTDLRDWPTKNEYGHTKSVYDCFWSAWKAFSGYEDDYQTSVTYAIRSSSASDTNAITSITGTLVAARNGLNNIPTKWLHGISLSGEVMEIIMNFTDNIVKKLV